MPIERNGSLGTSRNTGLAAVAATRVYEGRFARIDLKDGLTPAHGTGQAFAACEAKLIHDVRDGIRLGFRRLNYGHRPLPLSCSDAMEQDPFIYPMGVCADSTIGGACCQTSECACQAPAIESDC